MSEQEKTLVPSEVDRLRQLTEFLPHGNMYLYQFGSFLADRIEPRKKITPSGFVTVAELAINDLKNGVDGFTNQPLSSKLVGLPAQLYLLLHLNIPVIAKAVYGEDFAKQVEEIYQKRKEKSRNQQG